MGLPRRDHMLGCPVATLSFLDIQGCPFLRCNFFQKGLAKNILDEKKHVRAAMQYLNAVGGATLLDVLSRDEICKIMTSRIIAILKGQSADISFDDEDEDQLLEEV